ncbi:MAG: sensor domain-containing diguanylate cyclase [Pseudomonadota bacterium]|nr:sensor domain-containing diguanylate cyclase [Pseudomonadota bacterium]
MGLEQENARLQQTLKKLLARLEDNQRISDHFHSFELRLLGCKSLQELLDVMLDDAQTHFNLVDVGLILVDGDYTLEGVLDYLQLGRYGNRLQLRHNDDFAFNLYSGNLHVSLGEIDALAAGRLFPNCSNVKTAALMPLVRNGSLIGSLHFASDSEERFTRDKASDFLEFLASICGVCIENALTREHLRYQSQIDMLTQVRNRMSFDMEYAKELERTQRGDDFLTCIFADVDHFKSINDQYGHTAGDVCLKAVADAISEELRKTDLVARYGGEEFVILLPRCDEDAGRLTAERIRKAVESLRVDNVVGDGSISPTISLGMSTWNPVGETRNDLQKLGQRLLNTADEAMYEAKNNGRNQLVVKPFYFLV